MKKICLMAENSQKNLCPSLKGPESERESDLGEKRLGNLKNVKIK